MESSRDRRRARRRQAQNMDFEDFALEFGEDAAVEILEDLGYEPDDVEGFDSDSAGWDSDAYRLEVGGEEWLGFKSSDEAERRAVEVVSQDIEFEPEIFSEGFLSNHIEITETDRRLMAVEEADFMVSGMDDRSVLAYAGMEDAYEELEDEYEVDEAEYAVNEDDYLDEDGNLDEDAYEEAVERADEDYETAVERADEDLEEARREMVVEAREAAREEIYDEWYDGLDDPVEFLCHRHGLFDVNELLQQNFVSVNVDEAAQYAVNGDGVAHFLSPYDGNVTESANGTEWYRQN